VRLPFPGHACRQFDVREQGAAGDGRRLDTPAFNAAIALACAAGGGLVRVPAGAYRCFSIRLRSDVTVLLEAGATIIAADPDLDPGSYDLPDDRGEQLYQDFGHSHWHNSLIWGDGVRRVAILGPGVIDGRALTRDGPGARWKRQAGERPLSMQGMTAAEIDALERDAAYMQGRGNKAIGLVEARDVHLSGFTIRDGGHFAILATGVDGLVIEDLTIDTARDGIDLDGVRNARIERCRVNTPNDDAIVLKSSWALGRAIPCDDVVIRGCAVSGFDPGTLLDGSRGTRQQIAPDRDRVTGRIKLGTESNGGFRRIRIEDCRFERSRGLALETVDGGVMEDVIARDLRLHDVTTAPIFLRLGDRRRGPPGTGLGAMRGITLERIVADGIDPRFAAMLVGLPQAPIEAVTLRDIALSYRNGSGCKPAGIPAPELADAYPEPSMFGITPAWGLWARHVRGLHIDGLTLHTPADPRPHLLLEDVHDVTAARIRHTAAEPHRGLTTRPTASTI
jgi:polygalacturonase